MLKTKIVLLLLSAIISISLTACSQPLVSPPEGASAQVSEISRNTHPKINQGGMANLSDGNGEFAFDLYHNLQDIDGNLFFSPYSISQALAMTYAGAREETEKQMADTLHFTMPQADLHPVFNYLDLKLSSRDKGDKDFHLTIANALWGQEDYVFLPEFLDVLAENYGAGMITLDFVNHPQESCKSINSWVSDKTEGRIKDIISPVNINPDTRLVLTNAIYFKASWYYKFRESMTIDDTFHLLDGTEIKVPMMRQTETHGYAEGNNYQAVQLLYSGGKMSMIIILPEEGGFNDFQSQITYSLLQNIISAIERKLVQLQMPRFEFESEFSLKDILREMGMASAFENADFSGMTGSKGLFIADVLHKAFVLVDETGTEAAAATAVVMEESAPAVEAKIYVDRPFIFLIRDIETNSILFLGCVLNPSE
ncbi:MAG: serpin family protein [Dehalococcoidales bacterium]|nr:serpin family protein [Dehalococcoidales bacterium]